MIDLSFNIDHNYLKSIFKEYKIRVKWAGIQNTGAPTIDSVEIAPESANLARYLIGAVFQANEGLKEDVLANISNCAFALVEDWSNSSQSGKSIIPFRNNVIQGFTVNYPYDLPITILAENQILTDAIGNTHFILDGKMKFNLNYLMLGGHHLFMLSVANFATVDSVVIIVYAEGVLL